MSGDVLGVGRLKCFGKCRKSEINFEREGRRLSCSTIIICRVIEQYESFSWLAGVEDSYSTSCRVTNGVRSHISTLL